MARLIYLDNLRSILTVLVVGHHSALAASGLGRWYLASSQEKNEPIGLALVAMGIFTSQAFLTGLLFAVAGLLAVPSLAKKGPSLYVKARLWRLGLPVLLVGLPIHHLCRWLGQTNDAGAGAAGPGSAEGTSVTSVTSGPGVAWFQLWLLAFEIIFAIRGSPMKMAPQSLSFFKVLGVILAVAFVQYLVEMYLAKPLAGLLPGWKGLGHHIIHTPLYGFCFFCGSLSDSAVLLTMLKFHTKPLSIASILTMVLCFVFALGRGQSQPERASNPAAVAIGAVMTVLTCVGVSNAMLQHFKAHHSGSSILSGFSHLSYAVNMLHPVVVVVLTPVVIELPLGLLGQFTLLWLASTCASFAVAALLLTSSQVRKLL